MNYSVIWSPDAEEELTDIWLNAADRKAVHLASESLNRRLMRDADQAGESRGAGRRIIFAAPLGAFFQANFRLKTATVLHVWVIRPASASTEDGGV